MSGKAVGWVFDYAHHDCTSLEVFLLAAIAEASHDDGAGCWESTNELAHKTRTSVSWVKRHIQLLEDRNQLVIERGLGRGHVNRYRLSMTNEHGQTLQDHAALLVGRRARQKGSPQPPLEPAADATNGSSEPPLPDDKRWLKGSQKVHGPARKNPDPDPDPYKDPREGDQVQAPDSAALSVKRVSLDRNFAIQWARQHGLDQHCPRGIEAELQKFFHWQFGHDWRNASGNAWADETQAWRKWCEDVLDKAAETSRNKGVRPGDRDPDTGTVQLAI